MPSHTSHPRLASDEDGVVFTMEYLGRNIVVTCGSGALRELARVDAVPPNEMLRVFTAHRTRIVDAAEALARQGYGLHGEMWIADNQV